MNTGTENQSGNCAKKVTLKSPAKLNVGLKIIGRRTDGYHLLQSLFVPLNFYDTLEITPGPIKLDCQWAADANATARGNLPTNENNLAYKVLQKIAQLGLGQYQLVLQKRIPIQAGLGGGSSNAGTLLKYFISLFPKARIDLSQFAHSLGADVPFFLNPKVCWVRGIGDIIEEVQIEQSIKSSLRFVLCFGDFGMDTGKVFEAYKKLHLPFSKPLEFRIDELLSENLLKIYLQTTSNDLETPASYLSPDLKAFIRELKTFPTLYAGLSGSGSTCFALLQEEEKKVKALQQLCRREGWRSLVTCIFNPA